ncbi:MAG TPA: hypothetical protein DDW68_06610 [Verrucomicrobiales bacterium]|nr:hypothetical protein [Verrucomicrobiales bacterium]
MMVSIRLLTITLVFTLVDFSTAAAVQGYRGLFMGHSFFSPSADQLNQRSAEWGIDGHSGHTIFRGDSNGSPLKLWEDSKVLQEATDLLSEGQIELLALTYYSAENSRIEDYQQWFDLALESNPEIKFLITIPWPLGPHRITPGNLEELRTATLALFDSLITPLRQRYPNNAVIFCPYGLGAHELIESLFDGELAGVEYLSAAPSSNSGNEYLFRDATGHPNELVITLSTLIWANTLYGVDPTELDPVRVTNLPQVDLNSFAYEVGQIVTPYNEGLLPSEPPLLVRASFNTTRTHITLSWTGTSDNRYQIESSPDFRPGSWTLVETTEGVNGEMTWLDTVGGASIFFRIVPQASSD